LTQYSLHMIWSFVLAAKGYNLSEHFIRHVFIIQKGSVCTYWRFITSTTNSCHHTLSSVSSIQSTFLKPIPVIFVLNIILPSMPWFQIQGSSGKFIITAAPAFRHQQKWKVLQIGVYEYSFPNTFFVALHTSLALMFIHYWHKTYSRSIKSSSSYH
jgi:hypothetical protein